MKPRVVQCKHAAYKAARRNWKVQYGDWEYVYHSWYQAMQAARSLATFAYRIQIAGLVGVQKIQR